ncbi:MAG: hypothetical protein QNL33_09155 [Akkermansiaceae bacterium]
MKSLLVTLALARPLCGGPAWLKSVNIPKNDALKPISPTRLSYTMTWNGRLEAGN